MQPLPNIPAGSDVFVDANIFIYGLTQQSLQCHALLERCSREELYRHQSLRDCERGNAQIDGGGTRSKGVIASGGAEALRKRCVQIPTLIDYWRDTEKILSLNLLLFSTDEQIVRGAQYERQMASVLTNDSMILSWMRESGSAISPRLTGILNALPESRFLGLIIFETVVERTRMAGLLFEDWEL